MPSGGKKEPPKNLIPEPLWILLILISSCNIGKIRDIFLISTEGSHL
jgi:hypothetical protein